MSLAGGPGRRASPSLARQSQTDIICGKCLTNKTSTRLADSLSRRSETPPQLSFSEALLRVQSPNGRKPRQQRRLPVRDSASFPEQRRGTIRLGPSELWRRLQRYLLPTFLRRPLASYPFRNPQDYVLAPSHWVFRRVTGWALMVGLLTCLDGYMNVALEQTEEYVNGQLKRKYGDCFVRGNNVLYIRRL